MFEAFQEKHPDIATLSYIDDIKVSTSGRTPTNTMALQEANTFISNWGQENGVIFDKSKTELIHFKDNKSPNTPFINTDKSILAPSGEVKWLGIWLDQKLNFNKHRRQKQASGERLVNMLRSLTSTWKGLPLQQARHIYISAILPTMLWGSEIWWKNSASQLHSFILTQNKALRAITGAFKTSPIRALECEAAIPPLPIKLDLLANRFAIRLLSLPTNHPTRSRLPPEAPLPSGSEDAYGAPDILPTPGRHQVCHTTAQKPYYTHAHQLLGRLRDILSPGDEVEVTDPGLDVPWEEPPFSTTITTLPKDAAAEVHEKDLQTLLERGDLIMYTDGSMRD